MNVVYALQPLPQSIMLIGPTPRTSPPGQDPVPSWRPEALRILEQLGFAGTVFVPEAKNWAQHDHYDAQIAWEWEAIDQATVCACWLPRDLATMPAFTTNVEFGLKIASGRIMIGAPADAPKMSYLTALAHRFHAPAYKSLHDLLAAAEQRTRILRLKTER